MGTLGSERTAGLIDVLVVEDDAGTRTLLLDILRDAGYGVAAASDGAAGLALAERLRPRVILLDLWMPVMSGWQFATQYHASPAPHAALLLLSAHQDVPEATERLGAQGFIRKPFHLDQLLDIIAHVAHGSGAGSGRPAQRCAGRAEDLAPGLSRAGW